MATNGLNFADSNPFAKFKPKPANPPGDVSYTPPAPPLTLQPGKPPTTWTAVPKASPGPSSTPGMPMPHGGEGSCGAGGEGGCAGMHPPGGAPSTTTPSTTPPMGKLAEQMAAMVLPSQQSQSVYINGGESGQPLPSQADRAFRGRDPGISGGHPGDFLDILRSGFWGGGGQR